MMLGSPEPHQKKYQSEIPEMSLTSVYHPYKKYVFCLQPTKQNYLSKDQETRRTLGMTFWEVAFAR